MGSTVKSRAFGVCNLNNENKVAGISDFLIQSHNVCQHSKLDTTSKSEKLKNAHGCKGTTLTKAGRSPSILTNIIN